MALADGTQYRTGVLPAPIEEASSAACGSSGRAAGLLSAREPRMVSPKGLAAASVSEARLWACARAGRRVRAGRRSVRRRIAAGGGRLWAGGITMVKEREC